MDLNLNMLVDCELKCFNEDWCLVFFFVDEIFICRVYEKFDMMYEVGSVYYRKNCIIVLGKLKKN